MARVFPGPLLKIEMKWIISAAEMQQSDKRTIEEWEIPSCVLMEKAALAVAEKTISLLPREAGPILAVCGNGNNGGDGIAAARLLYLKGYDAKILMAMGEDRLSEECRRQLTIARHAGVPFVGEDVPIEEMGVILDALFGIGLSRGVEGRLASLLLRMNACKGKKIAVDIPSGVDANTGQILGTAFQADETVTMAYEKIGMALYPGKACCGNLTVADIGIYLKEASFSREKLGLLEKEDISWIFQREEAGNKGTFGKVLLVAGSLGMAGASILASSAALRAGAGMAKVVTVPENLLALQIAAPEVMVEVRSEEEAWKSALSWCDGLIIGPGLGKSEEAVRKVSFFLEEAKRLSLPTVVDADALNILAEHRELLSLLGERAVLTPHVGEMARLLGCSISEIKKDLVASAFQAQESLGATVVLKDASTVIAGKEESYLCPGGNPSLATAGSGDVLAGFLGATLVLGRNKKVSLSRQAACAVALHAMLGKRAREHSPYGRVLAGDIYGQLSYLGGAKEREEEDR